MELWTSARAASRAVGHRTPQPCPALVHSPQHLAPKDSVSDPVCTCGHPSHWGTRRLSPVTHGSYSQQPDALKGSTKDQIMLWESVWLTKKRPSLRTLAQGKSSAPGLDGLGELKPLPSGETEKQACFPPFPPCFMVSKNCA